MTTKQTRAVVSLLLSVTFACGVLIAVAHVLTGGSFAPGYDVVANLTAFACATAASMLLAHWIPALLSAMAFACWLVLARPNHPRAPERELDVLGQDLASPNGNDQSGPAIPGKRR